MSWKNILKDMTPEESTKKYLEITKNFMDTFIDLDAKFQEMLGKKNEETTILPDMKETLRLLKELKPKLDDYIEELDFQLEGR